MFLEDKWHQSELLASARIKQIVDLKSHYSDKCMHLRHNVSASIFFLFRVNKNKPLFNKYIPFQRMDAACVKVGRACVLW